MKVSNDAAANEKKIIESKLNAYPLFIIFTLNCGLEQLLIKFNKVKTLGIQRYHTQYIPQCSYL